MRMSLWQAREAAEGVGRVRRPGAVVGAVGEQRRLHL